jgi:putative DNA methylase
MVTPLSLKDAPALIERALPAQKLSAEAQKERKAGAGQTLTALGSYWKGRKPLILAKACILGCLLPASDEPEKDLDVFEMLMGMDEAAFGYRADVKPDVIARTVSLKGFDDPFEIFTFKRSEDDELVTFPYEDKPDQPKLKFRWNRGIDPEIKRELICKTIAKLGLTYAEKLAISKRPEELGDELYEEIWDEVNDHLGTEASSLPELVEQLGIMRYGHRPKVADTFCGGGSIPFEAARLGCDVYASDLNPIACMLTWGALNIIGADAGTRERIAESQKRVAEEVDAEITRLGIEHNERGDRAKAFLYCLETRCPQTGWMVPMAPNWVISNNRNVVAKLVPDHVNKRFKIEVLSGVSKAEMRLAKIGTVRSGYLTYELNGETYSTAIKTIRGDRKVPSGSTQNQLRAWAKRDFTPHPNDIWQERLYCIQWITKESLTEKRQNIFFAGISEEDLERDNKVISIVEDNLAEWQEKGLVSDMKLEAGYNTKQPIWERGWTHWHHLFNPRSLLSIAKYLDTKIEFSPIESVVHGLALCSVLDNASRLCTWNAGHPGSGEYTSHVFYNQALNTTYSYSGRSVNHILQTLASFNKFVAPLSGSGQVTTIPASELGKDNELFITDPPYADAIHYHEITEFFIAWLRKDPPKPFRNWVWDSRRQLAIQGGGDDFRREMADAYSSMAAHMPDNGMQVVMFTHQDSSVWVDMAAIFWGSNLRVTAAWYIATETTSELKKGGYVQGTVLLVLRKRIKPEQIYKDELVIDIRQEVEQQINSMIGLNQSIKKHEQQENLFEDADLQMAGFAAALKVLTRYTHIDSTDMTQAALRPRQAGETSFVDDIIELAVQIANEILVPDGLEPEVWQKLTGSERFYLKMLDIEAAGIHKLDNYQNFAKAFRLRDYAPLMASQKPNAAQLKSAQALKKSEFSGSEFGTSALRAILFALYELQSDLEPDIEPEVALHHLWENCQGRYEKRDRDTIHHICNYLALKLRTLRPEEAAAARILAGLLKTEHL